MGRNVGRYFFGQVMSPHHSDQLSQRSQAPEVTICVQYSKVAVSDSVSKGRYFFGQVMSPHHSDQMSQRSQVPGIAL